MSDEHEGGCLCGQIRYKVRGAPERVTICHCTFCQKITGSGYLVQPIFLREKFDSVGDTAHYEHVSDVSGAKVDIRYCPKCGTNVWLELARFPENIGIIGGTFELPNWFPRQGDNVRHIFTRSAQRGTVLPAGVALYAAHAVLPDGSAAEPMMLDEPYSVGSGGGVAPS